FDVPDWEFEWQETGDYPDWIGGGTDTETDRGAKAITQIIGQARDEGITRYRPRVIIAEQQADDANASKRADWEMRRRIAKSREATVTVNGWHQSNGDLWKQNLMVRTTIPWLSLDMDMLISCVDYIYGEEGELCTFTLTLPDAFLPEKFRKTKAPKKGRGAKGKGPAWYATYPVGRPGPRA
ncbi:MAG TPA: hypothetical protein VKB76_16115, partial [Ktedonobacterales bacterium]|nr:hypothetical protein [Ktedonobacterales bacterium]